MNSSAANLPRHRSGRSFWPWVWTVVLTSVLVWGSRAHLERYLTPNRGLGYWLGIIGGSMMLSLLIYSARKRYSWLRWLGGTPAWFRMHMVLGLVGPTLILFHANFSLGAANSNIALICMLLVVLSGIIGRYIYTRMHARMDDSSATLERLKAAGERIRSRRSRLSFWPELLDSIDAIESRLLEPPAGRIARFVHLVSSGPRLALARWRLRRTVDAAVRKAALQERSPIARHSRWIVRAARRYAVRRLDAGRRRAEYRRYAQLFSFWHVLHVPLFFMLLIAGIVHVIASNLY